jgi:hypothetical protein
VSRREEECGGLWWRIIISIDCSGASSLTYVIIICMTSRGYVPAKSDKAC